ncbi:HAMP domain-containing protein [Lysobacter psychrotolerans]|uniref:HAMP domain-containing protein n=1 Tax=Montanilutibacter psychrotolerans TaxID=1327343 RepID=A0A3M8SN89_9GAMM|nr:HAMP domain-containing protein [Lysobacter psychrotolerans]
MAVIVHDASGATVAADPSPPAPVRHHVPWYHSLRTRLLLWLGLACVVVLLGGTGMVYQSTRALLLEQTREELRSLAAQTAMSLNAMLTSVETSAATLAANALSVDPSRSNLEALLRSTVDGDGDVVGAMLIIEPGVFGPDAAGYDGYLRNEGTGYHRQAMHGPDYDYHVQPWWQRTVVRGQSFWSEPYRNAATGNEMFVTYNLPLRRPGDPADAAPVGIVSLDVPVRRLRRLLGAPAESQGPVRASMIERVLLSPERMFVVHFNSTVELRQTLDDRARAMPELEPMLRAVRGRRPLLTRYYDQSIRGARIALIEPLPRRAWTIALSIDEPQALIGLQHNARLIVTGGLFAIVLLIGLLWLIARPITRPLGALTASAGRFADGEFDTPLPHTDRRDEVGLLADALDGARGSIKQQMAEIEQMAGARLRLDSELAIAADIQQAMLPPAPQLRVGERALQAHALLHPATMVGGDFYGFFPAEPGRLRFCIGDVSDKGVPAALFMARCLTVLEVAAGRNLDPGAALAKASVRLAEHNDTCMFATVLFGMIDLDSGHLVLASAGHEPALLRRADGQAEWVEFEAGPPLGFEPVASYPEWHGRLTPGEALLAYTDGITEAFDGDLQAFGGDRLERAITAADTDASAAALCTGILDVVTRFVDGAAQSDDITLLALRVEVQPADR